MKRCFSLAIMAAVAFPIGCSNSSKETAAPAQAVATKPVQASTSVVPPTEIVAMFADSIRRGDRETTNKLITAAARQEIQKRGMAIDPPGSPEASYKIGNVRFIDEDRDAGWVESVWIEPSVNGEAPQSTEVAWAVQLEEQGWRISGLVIDMGADQPAAIVNFEDLEGSVDGGEEVTATDRVANAASPAPNANMPSAQTAGNGAGMPAQNSANAGFSAPPALNSNGFKVPETAQPQTPAVYR